MSPGRTGSCRDQRERGEGYATAAEAFAARPWCLGWHWCSWLENPHRGFGLKDPWDEPYRDLVDAVTETNHRLSALLTAAAPQPRGDRAERRHQRDQAQDDEQVAPVVQRQE